MTDTKPCSKCRETKPVTEFHRGAASFGRNAYCKACVSVHRKGRVRHDPATDPEIMERECSRCDTTKPAGMFHKSTLPNSGGRSFWCKACQSNYYRERVAKDPDYFNKFLRKNRAKRRQWAQNYKAAAGCADCGENHPACLDFHHKDATVKETEVCKLVDAAREMAVIEAEVAKCIVLCSNCHRKRHYNERHAAADAVA